MGMQSEAQSQLKRILMSHSLMFNNVNMEIYAYYAHATNVIRHIIKHLIEYSTYIFIHRVEHLNTLWRF